MNERRFGGSKAHKNGAQFEHLIDVACDRYARNGVAFVEKSPEPMRPIKPIKPGQFVAVFTKSAQPDYKGTLKGGRAIVFEAKHTESKRIEKSRVTDEQAAALDRHWALGALCFVLVSFGFKNFYRVPWSIWANMPTYFNKVSVNEKDLKPWKVNVLDFLEGCQEAE